MNSTPAELGLEVDHGIFQPTKFSSWTCILADRPLSEERVHNLLRKYKTDDGRQSLEKLLFEYSNKFTYSEKPQVSGDIGEAPYEGYGQAALETLKPYFTRLRIGQLKSKKIQDAVISDSWIRAYLCFKGRAKVTVSSLCELDDRDVGEATTVMREVLNTEEGIGNQVFDDFYGDTGVKKVDKRVAVVYKTPKYDGIKELQELIHEYWKLPDVNLAKELSAKIFSLLKEKYSKLYDDIAILLTGGEKERINQAILFPIVSPSGQGILAAYDTMTYGFTKGEPWPTCLQDLVNGILMRV